MSTRFVIEGEWSGYTSAQQHVVHRKVYDSNRKRLREWASKTYSIRYTDGTVLMLNVRDCKPYERVEEINGYTKLIEDCAFYDVSCVADLPRNKR